MGDGQPERLGHDLRGRGGAEELAAAAGAGTCAAAEVGRLLERDEPVREAGAEGLHGSGVLAAAGRKRDSARDHRAGKLTEGGERHGHRRQALVAGADGDHAASGRQAPNKAAEHERGVVAVGERVEHPGRPLGAPVARVGDVRRERERAEPVELQRRFPDEQAYFPVAGVVAERDRGAVVGTEPSLGREDQERLARGLRRVPAHTGVLRQPEDVARRPLAEQLGRQREHARRPIGGGLDVEEIVRRQLYRPRSRAVSHITSIRPGFASKI